MKDNTYDVKYLIKLNFADFCKYCKKKLTSRKPERRSGHLAKCQKKFDTSAALMENKDIPKLRKPEDIEVEKFVSATRILPFENKVMICQGKTLLHLKQFLIY